MDISDQLHCIFSAQITERDGSYQIELPDREVQLGSIDRDDTFQVAISIEAQQTGITWNY